MSYPKNSHLHNFLIRQIVGAACYADIAIAAGEIWSTNRLEVLIDDERFESYTGIYRRMRNGSISDNKILYRIQKTLEFKTLFTWRNHPLWPLLYDDYYHNDHILRALNSLPKNMRDSIFAEGQYDSRGVRLARHEVTHGLIKKIVAYENLNAFVAIMAFAREARENNIHRISAFCALQIQKLFPKVVCHTPQLYIRWPQLEKQLTRTIWSFPKTKTSMPWFSVKHNNLLSEIANEEKHALANHIKLPPKHVFRTINKNHLN